MIIDTMSADRFTPPCLRDELDRLTPPSISPSPGRLKTVEVLKTKECIFGSRSKLAWGQVVVTFMGLASDGYEVVAWTQDSLHARPSSTMHSPTPCFSRILSTMQ